MMTLVTGGSGYFGSLLLRKMQARQMAVRVYDISRADDLPDQVEFVQGDIRDYDRLASSCHGVAAIHHNVAQVPLARDKHLFQSVNVDGTVNLLRAALAAGVRKIIYTSSSAIFGAPRSNPVTEDTAPAPGEAYGAAKYEAEKVCREYVQKGLDVTIIRPRTILGHGRLGIFQILFEWVRTGFNVPVLGRGDNLYQFVHADDLAEACILAADRAGPAVYNIGTDRFGTMRQGLEAPVPARRDRLASEEFAHDTGRARHEADQPAWPLAAGGLSCPDVWKGDVLRHWPGDNGAGLAAALFQRRDDHRQLRLVPPQPGQGPCGTRRQPPSFGGQAGRPQSRQVGPVMSSYVAWGLVLLAGVNSCIGNLLLKQSRLTAPDAGMVTLLTSPWFIGGLVFYGINVVLFAKALDRLPVSAAYPILSVVGFALLTVSAAWIFSERLHPIQWGGLACILVGIFLVAVMVRPDVSSPPAPPSSPDDQKPHLLRGGPVQ